MARRSTGRRRLRPRVDGPKSRCETGRPEIIDGHCALLESAGKSALALSKMNRNRGGGDMSTSNSADVRSRTMSRRAVVGAGNRRRGHGAGPSCRGRGAILGPDPAAPGTNGDPVLASRGCSQTGRGLSEIHRRLQRRKHRHSRRAGIPGVGYSVLEAGVSADRGQSAGRHAQPAGLDHDDAEPG